MSKEAEAWLVTVPCKGTPMAIMDRLARMADKYGLCWPSQRLISQRTGFSINTVNSCMSYLEDVGYIQRVRRHNSRGLRIADGIQLNIGTQPDPCTYKEWRAKKATKPNSWVAKTPNSDGDETQPLGSKKDTEGHQVRQGQHDPLALKIKSSSTHVEVTLTPTQKLTYTHSLERARDMCAQMTEEDLWKAYEVVQDNSWVDHEHPLYASNRAAADAITQEISKRVLKGGGE